MEVSFQPIEEHHLKEINSIYNWYVLNSTATFHTEPVTQQDMLEFLYLNHPRYKSYAIMSGGNLAGYCFLTAYKKRQAYDRTTEVTVYLHPDQRGNGIGKVALQHLESVAVSVDVKNLIGIISGDNAGSIRLFEGAGYAKCAHFRSVGEKFGKVLDVVAYQKEL